MGDTSSSEGSTVDFLDPEEILKKIPELADDLEEPDDCFTEGKVAAAGLLTLILMRARIQFSKRLSGHLCVQGPSLGSTGDRAPCCLIPRLQGPASNTNATTRSSLGMGSASHATADMADRCRALFIAFENMSLGINQVLEVEEGKGVTTIDALHLGQK